MCDALLMHAKGQNTLHGMFLIMLVMYLIVGLVCDDMRLNTYIQFELKRDVEMLEMIGRQQRGRFRYVCSKATC